MLSSRMSHHVCRYPSATHSKNYAATLGEPIRREAGGLFFLQPGGDLIRVVSHQPSEGASRWKQRSSRAGTSHSAQPPCATSVLLPWTSSLRQPQPIPSCSFLDDPDALLEGLRCFTA